MPRLLKWLLVGGALWLAPQLAGHLAAAFKFVEDEPPESQDSRPLMDTMYEMGR
jgi:hypothetical protein